MSVFRIEFAVFAGSWVILCYLMFVDVCCGFTSGSQGAEHQVGKGTPLSRHVFDDRVGNVMFVIVVAPVLVLIARMDVPRQRHVFRSMRNFDIRLLRISLISFH